MAYDPDNIFAKILRGAIPCQKIFEDDFALAFHDIHPQAPVHALVIPKGDYENHATFIREGKPEEILGFFRALNEVVESLGIEEGGYRLIANCGANGGQEVPHYHVHILAGGALGPMVCKK